MISETFTVRNGKIEQRLFARIQALAADPRNEGKAFEATVEPAKQSAAWYQHKYYRGYLLEAIAAESFTGDTDEAHWFLKDKFLKYPATSWADIPQKHRKNVYPMFRETVNGDGEIAREMYAYIVSTSAITQAEFKDYIRKVEAFSADLQLSFVNAEGRDVSGQAAEYRKRGGI